VSTTRAVALFAAITAAVVLIGGWIMTRVYPGADARRAILISATVAVLVQLVAFAIARRAAARSNAIVGWGLGSLLRMVVLAVYALVVVRAFDLPAMPALISLAVFFFVSTLVEPLLLNG
jgi:hypothetical protein